MGAHLRTSLLGSRDRLMQGRCLQEQFHIRPIQGKSSLLPKGMSLTSKDKYLCSRKEGEVHRLKEQCSQCKRPGDRYTMQQPEMRQDKQALFTEAKRRMSASWRDWVNTKFVVFFFCSLQELLKKWWMENKSIKYENIFPKISFSDSLFTLLFAHRLGPKTSCFPP